MGFFTRLLGLKQEDEEGGGEGEGERSIRLNFQNHNYGERRLPCWLFVLAISMYRAVKRLFRKVVSIFHRAKPSHPLLPLQNPPTTQPLLLPTPTISSPSCYACSVEEEEEPTISPPSYYACYYACSVEEEEEEPTISPPSYYACSDDDDEEEEPTISSHSYYAFSDDNDEKEAEEEATEEEEEEEVKSVIVVVEERWIKHYSSRHRILLVGEGNFSFSACLAKAFCCASNIIATSLDSQAFLKEHYGNALSNVEELRSRGSTVMHGIDATTMANHHLLRHLKFDCIVYNFPYAGLQGLKNLPRHTQLERHRRLVRQFMENAREMISEEGEIHITHKTNGFHAEWKVESLACGRGLRLIEAVCFNRSDYPGYSTKCGFGGNRYFNCDPSKTYKFGLK